MAKPGQILLPRKSLVLFPELAGSLHCCGQQVRSEESSNEQIQRECNYRLWQLNFNLKFIMYHLENKSMIVKPGKVDAVFILTILKKQAKWFFVF